MTASKKDVAYDYLRKKIVYCELKPGDVIDDKSIANELGFSRTPVREAINKLGEEKMVQSFARRGIIVSPVSLHDLNDMLEARMLVEPFIIRKAIAKVDRETLEEFRASLKPSTWDSASPDWLHDDSDYRFHMYFTKVAGNSFITTMMDSLLMLSQRTRFMLSLEADRIKQTYIEHMDIIDCVEAKDEEGAAQAIQLHLANSGAAYQAVYQENVNLLLD
ncbi:GntR family transcriptional regulator [Bifidobacterium sp. ESL0763]|uniref:GntR family transcriptional regulator n=1 Tax=Bifidobacterium sp. ESL0763 TaxID=2983227 RepID=UPI0023F8E6D2|nr:GntR family transcriptional regulator [Bifidobacterium sp. ESL0763]MDF7664273.1 GntR family transcriptional regulator [Bifidobacterium sp. ESL0763]